MVLEKSKFCARAEIPTPDHPDRSLAAIPTTLSRPVHSVKLGIFLHLSDVIVSVATLRKEDFVC
jgi:hypothetical protein